MFPLFHFLAISWVSKLLCLGMLVRYCFIPFRRPWASGKPLNGVYVSLLCWKWNHIVSLLLCLKSNFDRSFKLSFFITDFLNSLLNAKSMLRGDCLVRRRNFIHRGQWGGGHNDREKTQLFYLILSLSNVFSYVSSILFDVFLWNHVFILAHALFFLTLLCTSKLWEPQRHLQLISSQAVREKQSLTWQIALSHREIPANQKSDYVIARWHVPDIIFRFLLS